MDLLKKITEARRYVLSHSNSNVSQDALGLKYTMIIDYVPQFFLEAISQIAKEKNARITAFIKKNNNVYEFTPSNDKKEVFITVGNKTYTMTEDYLLLENTTPEQIKKVYSNSAKNWFNFEKNN